MSKAQFDIGKEWIMWIVRIGAVVVVLVFLYLMISVNISRKEDVSGLTFQIINERFLYSPDCFVYEDNRPYPGIFDYDKLSQEKVESCISAQNHGIRISLTSEEEFVFELNKDILKDEVLCTHEKTLNCMKNKHYVLINKEGKLMPAVMEVLFVSYRK